MSPKPPKRPRRRAKQERARQTVQVVLDGAARVLAARGYAGASTNRIAEAAGVSVGTLYEYFADKDAVYDALIEREVGALVRAIEAEGEDPVPGASIDDVVRRLLAVAMGAMRGGPDALRSLEQVPGAVFRRRLEKAREGVIAYVRRRLEAHREELGVDDLGLAAFVVVSAAEGIGSNASDEQFDDRLAAETATLLTLYLTGGA